MDSVALANKNHYMLIGDKISGWRTSKLSSNTNLSEFEKIIFRPAGLRDEYPWLLSPRDFASWDAGTDEIFDKISKLYAWAHDGGTLVVILEKEFSLCFNFENDFDVNLNSLPKGSKLDYKSGERIKLCPQYSNEPSLAPITPGLIYECTINVPGGNPFLAVNRRDGGPSENVAVWLPHGMGRVLIAPPAQEARSAYYKALLEFADTLSKSQNALPAWTEHYALPDEQIALDELQRVKITLSSLEEKASALESRVNAERQLKGLFSNTGDDFLKIVQLALGELGLKTVGGPHPRADLIGIYNKAAVAIEAKGLDGCARETHLRQVDRWKLEVDSAIAFPSSERDADNDLKRYGEKLKELGIRLDNTDALPSKGIMIIGTFRKLLLEKRTEPDFPPPMLNSITRSNVCALSGLQLLKLVLEQRTLPKNNRDILDRLISTNGVFDGGKWSPGPTKKTKK
jgi:hypothetical protein